MNSASLHTKRSQFRKVFFPVELVRLVCPPSSSTRAAPVSRWLQQSNCLPAKLPWTECVCVGESLSFQLFQTLRPTVLSKNTFYTPTECVSVLFENIWRNVADKVKLQRTSSSRSLRTSRAASGQTHCMRSLIPWICFTLACIDRTNPSLAPSHVAHDCVLRALFLCLQMSFPLSQQHTQDLIKQKTLIHHKCMIYGALVSLGESKVC